MVEGGRIRSRVMNGSLTVHYILHWLQYSCRVPPAPWLAGAQQQWQSFERQLSGHLVKLASIDDFLVVPGAVKKVCVASEHLICMSFGSQPLVVANLKDLVQQSHEAGLGVRKHW